MLNIGLIGNPNCGKTALFNYLTKSSEKTGNWSGVTVKDTSKVVSFNNQEVCLTDCPGINALTGSSSISSQDMQLTVNQLLSGRFDLILNVIDVSNISRGLYLTSQLLEAGFKVVVVANMLDLAEKKGIKIEIDNLSKKLNCKVISINTKQSTKQKGISELLSIVEDYNSIKCAQGFVKYPELIRSLVNKTINRNKLKFNTNLTKESQALWWIENTAQDEINSFFNKDIKKNLLEDLDIIIADSRYAAIDQIVSEFQSKTYYKSNLQSVLDAITMHRFLGAPIFFLIMYIVLALSINIGGLFQDFFDSIISIYYINNFQYILSKFNVPTILTSVLTTGIGQGINTILSFLPIIGSIFILLALLEDSGYMTRATFALNRIIVFLGLPSKAFIPLIIGFGCNVPGIIATRGIDNYHDKLITVMMSPFLSCSARLAVYTVFASVFFQHGGHNVIFLLYLLGVFCALLTGYLLRKYIVTSSQPEFIYEMPSYKLPSLKLVVQHTLAKLRRFISQTGKYILYVCVALSILNEPSLGWIVGSHEGSILVAIGKFLTPLFIPMGLTVDNWQITVSFLSGLLAKEAILGTLNTLYTQQIYTEAFELIGISAMWEIANGIWTKIASFPSTIFNLTVIDEVSNISLSAREFLSRAFFSYKEVFAYLVFISLYMPCLSTAVVISKELNKKWMIFSLIWSTILAYGLAVIFYQIMTFNLHPISSITYIGWVFTVFIGFWTLIKFSSFRRKSILLV